MDWICMEGEQAEHPRPSISPSFASLSDEQRRVLQFAVAMGKEFDFSILWASTGMDEEALAEVLEDLVHRGVLKEFPGGDLYAFVLQSLMVEAYLSISSTRQRLIHRRIAEAYEHLHPEPPPEVVPLLGRHFHLGGVHDRSILYNRYSARLATHAFSPDLATYHLGLVREDLSSLSGDHRLEEADVLRELGDLSRAVGDSSRADDLYAESLSKLPGSESTLRALTLISRADATLRLGKLGQTRQLCSEAIGLLEAVGHKKGLALAHRTLGRVAFKEGRVGLYKKEIEKTLDLLDQEKDRKEVARCFADLGNVFTSSDDAHDQEVGIGYYRKAIETFEALEEYRESAKARNNLALTLVPTSPREALRELMAAKACAEKARDRRVVGWTLYNTVELLLGLGEEREAAENNEQARQIFSRLNDPIAIEQVTLNDGILAQHRRSFKEAESAYVEAVQLAEKLGYPNQIAEASVHLATLYADWGKRVESLRALSRLDSMAEDKILPDVRALCVELKKRLGIMASQ
jgi:tetratricopeptide (TPR) repeat protein